MKRRSAKPRINAMCALAAIALGVCSCGDRQQQERQKAGSDDCVYICTGRTAKRYHSVEDCKGLSNCSGRIITTSLQEAEEEGKTPCRMCVR